MKSLFFALIPCVIASNCFAGGAVVAGGKTHTAIIIDEARLDACSIQMVREEIQKLLATHSQPNLLRYEVVTDLDGRQVMCASFFSSVVSSPAVMAFEAIAEKAGVPTAVRTGSCRFDVIN